MNDLPRERGGKRVPHLDDVPEELVDACAMRAEAQIVQRGDGIGDQPMDVAQRDRRAHGQLEERECGIELCEGASRQPGVVRRSR